MIRKTKRKGQDGYALLFVTAMAAAIAIKLYMELPRLAFETRRAKEDKLVDRAEQYKRGIQLYYRKLKKFPQTLDDLENTNQIRYVRQRYVDPFSGKDDWRLIHTNGTQLTDSLVKKPGTAVAGQTGSTGPPSSYDSQTTASFGSTAVATLGNQSPGGPRRASEMQGFMRAPDGSIIPDPSAAQTQQQNQPQTAYAPGYQPPPNPYGAVPQVAGQQPGAPPPPFGQQPNTPGRFLPPGIAPGQPGQPGQIPGYPTTAANSQNSFGGGGQPQTAQLPTTGANPALDMIQRILTQPRPGGLPGLQAGTTPIASGIVGVASKYDADGIKIFDERTNIKEWEFVYDPTKDKTGQSSAGPAQVGAPIGSGSQQQGNRNGGFNQQQGQQPVGGFGQQPPGGFGQQPPGGFGQQTPLNRPR